MGWMITINEKTAATAKAKVDANEFMTNAEKALVRSQVDLVVSGMMTDDTREIFAVMINARRGDHDMTCIVNLGVMAKAPPDVVEAEPLPA